MGFFGFFFFAKYFDINIANNIVGMTKGTSQNMKTMRFLIKDDQR